MLRAPLIHRGTRMSERVNFFFLHICFFIIGYYLKTINSKYYQIKQKKKKVRLFNLPPPIECLKCVRNRARARSVVGNLLCSVPDAASNVDSTASVNTQLVETGLAARASSRHGESFLIVTEGRIYMTHYK